MNEVSSSIFSIYFSPFTAHVIEYKGVVYPTLEHAYHCQRYTDPAIQQEVMLATSPIKAWEISQNHKARQIENFDENKREVMKKLCRVKIAQHDDVRRALLDSGDIRIVKRRVAGPQDAGYWGENHNGMGRNELGKIWMELRDELLASKKEN